MNAIGLLMLALGAGTGDDVWSNAPTVELQGHALNLQEERPKSTSSASDVRVFQYPDGPPLTAEKMEDGTLRLRHRDPATEPQRSNEAAEEPK